MSNEYEGFKFTDKQLKMTGPRFWWSSAKKSAWSGAVYAKYGRYRYRENAPLSFWDVTGASILGDIIGSLFQILFAIIFSGGGSGSSDGVDVSGD